MLTKLVDGIDAAIGSRYLKMNNQLVFVEYSAGAISKYDLVLPVASTVSSGTMILKGTWIFDCETGLQGGNLSGPGDIWWEQVDPVHRQMTPISPALIVNLGAVNFNKLTPAAMQMLTYSSTPINGNKNTTNKLVNGDVFCVRTKQGNYCKIKVVTYGYNMKIQYVTYHLADGYAKLGTGYTTPEDIAVLADEHTAYVNERTGNFLRIDLGSANRASAVVVAAGLHAPHQIWIDEAHNQGYVVEYANPGRLLRIDLGSGTVTTLYATLNLAIGLVVSSDLAYAYISEQGTNTVSRITLSSGVKTVVASGLTAPFFMAWADDSQSAIFITERDPANHISLVNLSTNTFSVLDTVPFRPSSVAVIKPGVMGVFCNTEIDLDDFTVGITPLGLYKGIGYVPWNLIDPAGKADTTTQPTYPFQFPKDSPFGGTLPVLIDHYRAWEAGLRYYRVLVDGSPRLDTWYDLVLNTADGKYEIPEQMVPKKIGAVDGFYAVHNPIKSYYNSDLGCLLASTTLTNSLHTLTVEFYTSVPALVQTGGNPLLVDNNQCVAKLEMPLLDGHNAEALCGVLKYVDPSHIVYLSYTASHPNGFANYYFSITKGANTFDSLSGPVLPPPPVYQKSVALLLGTCTIAAFAEYLYVATTVINGVGRQSQYDASAIVAFCLAP